MVRSNDGLQFVRGDRLAAPRVPGGDIVLEAPPEIPRVVPGNILLKLLPVVMVAAMVAMMALMFTSGAAKNPMALLFPAMMVVSMLGMFAGGAGRSAGSKPGEIDETRKDYLAYLDRLRDEVAETASAQRTALTWAHPTPTDLWTLAGTPRMWERRPTDADFAHVRVGVGSQRLATRLVAPETGPVDVLEPVAAVSLRSFVRTHSIVCDLPTAVSLRGFAAIAVEGDRASARAMVRSIIMQLCMFHGPDDLELVLVLGSDVAPEWEWAKWLPHANSSVAFDGAGSARSIYSTLADATEALGSRLDTRGPFVRHAPAVDGSSHVVVLIDGAVSDSRSFGRGGETRAPWTVVGADAMTVIDLADCLPDLVSELGIRLVTDGSTIGARSSVGLETFGSVDAVDEECARGCARTLARYLVSRSAGPSTDSASTGSAAWHSLVGISDPATVEPERGWTRRRGRERLRVPIGIGVDGRPVEIDLKEASEGGMGPHGLCIGATGSGKSEFLRTLVLGLIATHSPDVLNLVLVDFKGGATFLGLERSRHVAAVITNLADERGMVERMRDALAGEMNRRQELLRSAGNFANVSDYEKARENGVLLDPLPALFIVVDEFSELLSQYPDFADLFVAIGRLGRSLHMHLLLASQRLDEGRLRGLDSHLSYRIGLKTFSANESRSVLGVTDAYHLPSKPGAGYLKTDSSDIVRFSAAYVSGAYEPAQYQQTDHGAPVRGISPVRAFTAESVPLLAQPPSPVPADADPAESATGAADGRSVLEVVVGRLSGHGRPAHRVWLPPLDSSPTVDDFALTRAASATLSVPIGAIDRPFDQRRDDLMVDLTGSRGHVAIVGGPQSGKSTALRTLVLSLARANSVADVQFYCLDFGGGALSSLESLPHVGSIAAKLDVDLARRTIAELSAIVRRRERQFRLWGVESMTDFRTRRAAAMASSAGSAGDGPHTDPLGDIFLVIDGWSVVRSDFEALETTIAQIATQGLSFGVHVVISATRWAEIRPSFRDLLLTRIELRLGDPTDSDVGRSHAMSVPEGRPGRGVTKEGLHLLTALPRTDGIHTNEGLAPALAVEAAALAELDPGRVAPKIGLLPLVHTLDTLLADVGGSWPLPPTAERAARQTVPIGIDEADLAPVFLDFNENPHLLVFGDGRCGKSTLLRTICQGIAKSSAPSEAKIIVADYRRTMLGAVDGDHLGGYASTSTLLTTMVTELAEVLRGRRPGADTTQEQLRQRSWWTGPDVYVVVDDYDLVVTPAGNPLIGLLEFLPQARDVGLHVILARRSGGSSRALYEPLMARLKDLASPGLVMSGSRDEGALLGNVKPSELPAGRGVLVTRGRSDLVQTAWMPPL